MELAPSIAAIAFDAVGTLIHPDPPAGDVYAAVAERHGCRVGVAEIHRRFGAAFGAQEGIDAANGFITSEERERQRWQAIVAAVLDDVDDPAACIAELYEHFAQPRAWRCEPGLAALFARLTNAGHLLAIASNFDHRLRSVLAGLPPLAAIATVVISSEVGWRKPSPAFFTHLATALRLPPQRVLYVGDDFFNDFLGAGQARMPAVLFDPHGRSTLSAPYRIGALDELLRLAAS